MTKNPPVCQQGKTNATTTIQISSSESKSSNNENNINNNDIDTHMGKFRHSKTKEDIDKFLMTNHMDKVGKQEEEDNQIVSSHQTNSQRKSEV